MAPIRVGDDIRGIAIRVDAFFFNRFVVFCSPLPIIPVEPVQMTGQMSERAPWGNALEDRRDGMAILLVSRNPQPGRKLVRLKLPTRIGSEAAYTRRIQMSDDFKDLGVAVEELEEMVDVLDVDIRNRNFDNDQVVWLIKAWSKVNLLSGLNVDSWGYWLFKWNPPRLVGKEKRSQVLRRALVDYLYTLKPGNESGDYYRRAERALLDFVFEYHQRIVEDVNANNDFVHQIQQLLSAGRKGLMETAVFKMDQQ